jgi:hypothetical protein
MLLLPGVATLSFIAFNAQAVDQQAAASSSRKPDVHPNKAEIRVTFKPAQGGEVPVTTSVDKFYTALGKYTKNGRSWRDVTFKGVPIVDSDKAQPTDKPAGAPEPSGTPKTVRTSVAQLMGFETAADLTQFMQDLSKP